MKRIGTVSYNIYCNFTNYGSALQTWALHQAVKELGHKPVLVDYCPEVLSDKHPLNPLPHMWDQDDESKKMVEMSMPAIKENYAKFDRFYQKCFERTSQQYREDNFEDIIKEELDGYICGSDTIFCIDEFGGFDNGYYANYNAMKGRSVSYGASFGDQSFDEALYVILNERLSNFRAIGLRENRMVSYVKQQVNVPVERTIDPTLLLSADYYDVILAERQYYKPYLLLYTRRYDPRMEAFAEKIAQEQGLQVVEISLRFTNGSKNHSMRYDAGVEEFLSLVRYSSYVVTNSFHGLIFAVQYRRPVTVFTREQADEKINELLELLDIQGIKCDGCHELNYEIDYEHVHSILAEEIDRSMNFLQTELELL